MSATRMVTSRNPLGSPVSSTPVTVPRTCAAFGAILTMGVGQRLGLGDGAGGAYSDTRAAGLGAASFFLPCGFTQAVQIYALSTGSPLFAGALLATFAIGTAPGLLALAGLPVVVPSTARPTLLRLVGVVVIGFAVVNASAGIRLSGVTLPAFGIASVAAAVPPPGPVVDGKQILHRWVGQRQLGIILILHQTVEFFRRWAVQTHDSLEQSDGVFRLLLKPDNRPSQAS